MLLLDYLLNKFSLPIQEPFIRQVNSPKSWFSSYFFGDQENLAMQVKTLSITALPNFARSVLYVSGYMYMYNRHSQ